MSVNYTFIIPHRNIPDLLRRCLDSIPYREDIQIIVVDDNSDPSLVDFNCFPGVGEVNVEVYFTKEGKGAGYARNVGLAFARGKWVFFADADDFYNESLSDFLVEYLNSSCDVVFFRGNSVLSNTLESVQYRDSFMAKQMIKNSKDRNNMLRYKNYVPWNKMIKLSLLKSYNILFEEVEASNDCYFSVQVGYYLKSMEVSPLKVYCATVRRDSLWYKDTMSRLQSRINVCYRVNRFFKQKGVCGYEMNPIHNIYKIRKYGSRVLFDSLILFYRECDFKLIFIFVIKFLLFFMLKPFICLKDTHKV